MYVLTYVLELVEFLVLSILNYIIKLSLVDSYVGEHICDRLCSTVPFTWSSPSAPFLKHESTIKITRKGQEPKYKWVNFTFKVVLHDTYIKFICEILFFKWNDFLLSLTILVGKQSRVAAELIHCHDIVLMHWLVIMFDVLGRIRI